MKLVVVGSHVLTPSQYDSAQLLVYMILDHFWFATIGSGGAAGVDTIVKDEVLIRPNQGLQTFLPKNPRWEPDGYKDRNLEMARWCDMLISIRAKDSTTYGSGWTADRAEEMGKVVRRYYV